ncbi:MAG: hypothetical protein GY720_12065, partial [bacterium]|nr:hypothetical protein [bacterium]
MTNVVDRPESDSRSPIGTVPRPLEAEREPIRRFPTPEKPRRPFRWLGWLLAFVVVAVVAGILYTNVTSEEELAAPFDWETVKDMPRTQPVEIPPVTPEAIAAVPDWPTQIVPAPPALALGPFALETYEMDFILEHQPTLDISALEPAIATPRWTLGPWTLQTDELNFILEHQPTLDISALEPAIATPRWTLGPW